MTQQTWKALAVMGLLLWVGCSSPAGPKGGPTVTVLVENPLCAGTACRPIQIRVFVWKYEIPQGGYIGIEVLGEVAEPTACLEFPEGWDITVNEVDSGGNIISSHTKTATLDDEVFLTILDWDSSMTLVLARTNTFIPSSSGGWHLRLQENADPHASPYSAQLTTAPRCSTN